MTEAIVCEDCCEREFVCLTYFLVKIVAPLEPFKFYLLETPLGSMLKVVLNNLPLSHTCNNIETSTLGKLGIIFL